MGHADFPAEQLSNLIGLIYDCALEPERWQVAIGAIAEACDSRIGIMGIHDLSNSQYGRIYEYGYDPLFWAVYEKYAPENPMFVHGHLREVGEVTTLAMACSDDEFYGSRFYRECLKPYGYLDAMGIHAMRSGSRIAVLATNRTDREPRYSELDVQRLAMLSPHICRAVKISDALELKTLASEMLESTLDGLAAGVFLVARDGRVVYMNGAAENQVRTGRALRISNHRICPADPGAAVALAKAIDNAVTEGPDLAASAPTLALPDGAGAGLLATVLPLERGRRQHFAAPFAAAVALFVQDPEAAPQLPGEGFARLYGLTGSELRVALAIAPGLTAQEAADMLGIGLQTVKTHLHRIFEKTGTARQTDLIALIMRATPPVAFA